MNAPICFNYTENLTGIFNRITEGLRAKCYLLANSIIMPVCCYTLWSVNLCFIISLGNKDIEVKELALIFESVGFFFLRFFLMWNVFKVFLECVTMLLLASVLCFGLWPWGLWDLSSPTRDWTSPALEGKVLTISPPGKTLSVIFIMSSSMYLGHEPKMSDDKKRPKSSCLLNKVSIWILNMFFNLHFILRM